MICLGIDPGDRLILQNDRTLDAVITETTAQPVHSPVYRFPFFTQMVIGEEIELDRAVRRG